MPMYNLLEYSDNYSMTLERLWKYCRDELDVGNDNGSKEKSFEYETKIIGNIPVQPDTDNDGNIEMYLS